MLLEILDDMMKRVACLVLAASLLVVLCSGCNSEVTTSNSDISDSTSETEPVDFDREVLPILELSCFPCHGPQIDPLSSGFRVDLQEHAVGGGKIVPGDPDESLLIQRLVTKQDSKRMPPLKSDNPQLNPQQIDLLKRWIKEGASFGTH